MQNKRPIDIKRNSGLSTHIGTKADGAILEMCNFNGKLIVIKEESVYDFVLADDIDPARENPDLPTSIQRLILNYGSNSELVSRTFLTAVQLLKKEYLTKEINIDLALSSAFDATIELTAMQDQIESFTSEIQRLNEEYECRLGKELPYMLPSMIDLKTRCKTIFQKAAHVLNSLLEIVRVFYIDFGDQYYTKFSEYIIKKYGRTDPFSELLEDCLPFICLIKDIRNCLEHKKKELVIKDYDLNPNNGIMPPTIELDFNGSSVKRILLTDFLPEVSESIMVTFEEVVAHMCAINANGNRFIPHFVDLIPIELRQNKYIKYGYSFSV